MILVSQKVNVKAQMELQLAFYDVAVDRVNQFTTWTPSTLVAMERMLKDAVCCFEQILEAAPYKKSSCSATYLLPTKLLK